MSLIPPSTIDNCGLIKTDRYWIWVMSNVNSWKNDDRNHVISHISKFKPEHSVPRLQGMQNDELYRLLEDCVCLYAKTASEVNTCACVGIKNLFIQELKKYNAALTKKTLEDTKYNAEVATRNQFLLQRLDFWKNDFIRHWAQQETCDGRRGWNQYHLEPQGVGHERWCRRGPELVELEMSKERLKYPEPIPPVNNVPQIPVLNLLCCSQSFSNISGDKVSLKDINQECKLSVINKETVDKGTKGDTTEQAKVAVADKSTIKDEDDPEPETDYTLYIILAILVCISSCCCSIIVGGGGFFLMNT
jgi:hypothetical protein